MMCIFFMYNEYYRQQKYTKPWGSDQELPLFRRGLNKG